MSSRYFVCIPLAFIVLSCISIWSTDGVSQIYNYNVTVQTAGSPKFDDHDGKLKIKLLYKTETATSEEDFVLTPNAVKIEPNHHYESTIASFGSLVNISSIYLRWTLASPYNPIYKIKKPSIYFDSLSLTQINSDSSDYITTIKKRRFCPPVFPVGIKHSDGATFYPCI
ncbi:uncharacterized protein LOC107370897 [Tetranychus urticae]|uniref:Uncharacterized protein n=1 Tax=Tetranychus urticae TaxID=32264 RepID=T1JV65_TETUR|nr:uncharacterized protein LOC107370897 [Tetranychus urticae]